MARSGVPAQVFSAAYKTITINDFLENPPQEAYGAYALGLSQSTGDIYNQIAKNFNMLDWQSAYKKHFGATWHQKTGEPDITNRFMQNITGDEPYIVFFLPNDATTKREKQKYTREEIEYLIQNPDKLAKVIFVLGSYDLMEPKDYDNMVASDEEGWPRNLSNQEKLMQNVLKNPKLHGKPGQPY